MIKKFQNFLRIGAGRHKYPLYICIAIMAVYATCTLFYLAGVVFKFLYPNAIYILDFAVLDNLMARISDPRSVALYVFCIKAFVDTDKDGIPDQFEDKDERHGGEK